MTNRKTEIPVRRSKIECRRTNGRANRRTNIEEQIEERRRAKEKNKLKTDYRITIKIEY
jgi:hypothetical protein